MQIIRIYKFWSSIYFSQKRKFVLLLLFISYHSHAQMNGRIGQSIIHQAMDTYATENNIDANNPSQEFVGFISDKLLQPSLNISIFHSPEAFETLIKNYECSAINNKSACKLTSEDPRCFYYSSAGRYSLNQFKTALSEILSIINDPDIFASSTLKIWENDGIIYGKIDEQNFVCSTDLLNNLSCSKSIEIPKNEP